MAIIRNTASAFMRGKVGNTSYYTSNGRQVARQAMNNSNYGESAKRTLAQQKRRVMWSNLVNFAKVAKPVLRGAFQFKKEGLSDYNEFMRVNLPGARVALTKEQAALSTCVISNFQVSSGDLTSIPFDKTSGIPLINVSGLPADVSAMTVGQFAQYMIDGTNCDLREGDGIFVAIFGGSGNRMAGGYNPAWVEYAELTLDTTDQRDLIDVLPGMASHNEASKLNPAHLVSRQLAMVSMGMVVIHTRKENGKLRVSTESVMLTEDGFLAETSWTNPSIIDEAVASYGISGDPIIAPKGDNSGTL